MQVTAFFLESDLLVSAGMDHSGFADIHVVPANASLEHALDVAREIRRGAFDVVFYPQCGMHSLDLLLSNQRLAPVQVVSYGHSASTHGSLVDYFIGGHEVELPSAQEHYSERLLLVPGLGVVFNEPPAVVAAWRAAVPLARPPGSEVSEVLIACSWTMLKINYGHLERVRALVDTVRRLVRLARRDHADARPAHCGRSTYARAHAE
jgi:hypothetical protein